MFRKNLPMSSNILHCEPKTEHLECGPFVESSFVQAAFSCFKFYLTKKQFAPFSSFWYGLSFCWLVFPCNILSESIDLKLL